MLDRKTIIWQLFGCYVYYPFLVVTIGVSDVSADVGVLRRAVKTLWMNIYVS